jgi:hypothetical protein
MDMDEAIHLRTIAIAERHAAYNTVASIQAYTLITRPAVSFKPGYGYAGGRAFPETSSIGNNLGRGKQRRLHARH